MKKGKIVLWIFLCFIFALVIGATVYCYPRWRSAASLQENMDLEHFTYDIELELDKEALSSKEEKAINMLAQITGRDAENFYDIRIAGNMWEDKIYVQLFTKNIEGAVLELYLSEEADILNGTILYNVFRQKLVGDSKLLDALIPTMEAGVYMTVEQVEKMLGRDLSILREFAIDTGKLDFKHREYFILLALMSRQKQGNGNVYRFTYDTAEAELSVTDELRAGLAVKNPMDVANKLEEKLAFVDIQLPAERLEAFKSIEVTVKPGEGENIVMPTNIMSEEAIDLLTEARALMEQFVDRQ